MTPSRTLPVTVIVPTIGRVDLLRSCLRSLAGCAPAAQEILVVDQSGRDAVRDLVAQLDDDTVRLLTCDGQGTARATNRGLEAARHDTVAVTHDDCTVAADWVDEAARFATAHPGAIVTGRVLPPDGSVYVPSTKSDPEPEDYTGRVTSGVLYPANMVADRRDLLAMGGFDERRTLLVAEDNDLCYRWLRDGRPFRYEPAMVVWHHDWRTPAELVRTHVAYARAQGAFYAKHLHAGDRGVLPLLRWDLRHGASRVVRGVLGRVPRWRDPYREMVWWLLVGLVEGWREARAIDRRA